VTDVPAVNELLQDHGLLVLGAVEAIVPAEFLPGGDRPAGRHLVLAGNAGSTIWPAFERSPEKHDGLPHPMDRWSRRIGTDIACELDAGVIFPFEGPPYPPVLDWARQSGQAFPSPISMFIHGQYGLWHAYRFVLVFSQPVEEPFHATQSRHPCLSCATQACLSACPVDAFTPDHYRVKDCVSYLADTEISDCRQYGCNARRACPVAAEFHYRPGQARFHMQAFLESQTQAEK
jgi:ferredoxin